MHVRDCQPRLPRTKGPRRLRRAGFLVEREFPIGLPFSTSSFELRDADPPLCGYNGWLALFACLEGRVVPIFVLEKGLGGT